MAVGGLNLMPSGFSRYRPLQAFDRAIHVVSLALVSQPLAER